MPKRATAESIGDLFDSALAPAPASPLAESHEPRPDPKISATGY